MDSQKIIGNGYELYTLINLAFVRIYADSEKIADIKETLREYAILANQELVTGKVSLFVGGRIAPPYGCKLLQTCHEKGYLPADDRSKIINFIRYRTQENPFSLGNIEFNFIISRAAGGQSADKPTLTFKRLSKEVAIKFMSALIRGGIPEGDYVIIRVGQGHIQGQISEWNGKYTIRLSGLPEALEATISQVQKLSAVDIDYDTLHMIIEEFGKQYKYDKEAPVVQNKFGFPRVYSIDKEVVQIGSGILMPPPKHEQVLHRDHVPDPKPSAPIAPLVPQQPLAQNTWTSSVLEKKKPPEKFKGLRHRLFIEREGVSSDGTDCGARARKHIH